jgi:serine/threonine-protein kinase RsbW
VSANISVTVPARSEFLSVLRAVAASVAARLEWPYDVVDDLRIAVDEACAQLLNGGRGGKALTVRFEPSEDGMDLTASTDAAGASWPPPDVEESLAWQVLTALTDEVSFERAGDLPTVRLRKRGQAR